MRQLFQAFLLGVSLIVGPSALGAVELTGRVETERGDGVAGADVKLYYNHCSSGYGLRLLSQTKSDAQGNFTITRPDFTAPTLVLREYVAGRCCLVGIGKGYAVGFARVIESEREGYVIMLHPGHSVTCIVTDEDGNPVPDAEIMVQIQPTFAAPMGWGRGDGVRPIIGDLFTTRTGKDGTAFLSHLPLVQVDIRAADVNRGVYSWGPAMEGHDDVDMELNRRRAARVRGTVTFATDANAPAVPAAHMVVAHMTRWQGAEAWTMTDEQGKFDLSIWMAKPKEDVLLQIVDPHDPPVCAVKTVKLSLDEDAQKDLKIELGPGRPFIVSVTNAATAEPVAGAVVRLELATPEGAEVRAFRMSDKAGKCDFRVEGKVVHVYAYLPETGYVRSLSRTSMWMEKDTIVDHVDLQMELVPEAVLNLVVKDANGKLAPDASIFFGRDWLAELPTMKTDAKGELRLPGLAEGKAITLYALSDDRAMAALVTLPPLQSKASNVREVVLRPARAAQIILKEPDGPAHWGNVSAQFLDKQQLLGYPRRADLVARETPEDGVRVLGLLPDVEYLMSFEVERGFRVVADEHGDRSIKFRFADDDQNPKRVVALEPDPWFKPGNAAPESTSVTRTEEDFKRDLAAVNNVIWKKEDPIQKNLTWFAEKSGLAMADADRKEVKHLTELLGSRNFTVSGIAFGQDKVWLGTDKGLFAWDRRDQYWSAFAVAALYVDEPVTDVSLSDGKLRVSVKLTANERDETRKYEYDIASSKWTASR